MNYNKILSLTLPLFLIVQSCGVIKMNSLRQQATIINGNVESKIPFKYYQNEIFVELEIQGKSYNFIFDTAADLTVLDDNILKSIDYENHTTGKMGDASNIKNRLNLITIPEINILDIKFKDVGAVTTDLKHFQKRINCPKIDGIIGLNMIRKINWKIDYKNSILFASNNLIVSPTKNKSSIIIFTIQKLGRITGKLQLDNKTVKTTLDTGYSGGIQVNGKKSKIFWSQYPGGQRTYRISESGTTLYEKESKKRRIEYIKTSAITLNKSSLENQIITLSNGSNLIGNSFLEDYIIILNYSQNQGIITSIDPMKKSIKEDFEVLLHPNYNTNKIEIMGFMENAENNINIKSDELEIIALNDYEVYDLTTSQLCSFWEGIDNPYKNSKQFVLKVRTKNGLKEITLKKQKYL